MAPTRNSRHSYFLQRRFWDEARADQAMGQQIREPSRVGDVGLATRHVLYMRRVRQDQGEAVRGQDVPDRLPLPVDAGVLEVPGSNWNTSSQAPGSKPTSMPTRNPILRHVSSA